MLKLYHSSVSIYSWKSAVALGSLMHIGCCLMKMYGVLPATNETNAYDLATLPQVINNCMGRNL